MPPLHARPCCFMRMRVVVVSMPFFIFIMLLSIVSAHQTSSASLSLPSVDYASSDAASWESALRKAFVIPRAPGVLLVRNVPEYVDARKSALNGLAKCNRTSLKTTTLGDGRTKRHTVAANTGQAIRTDACDEQTLQAMETLRASVGDASSAALARLDDVLGTSTNSFFANAATQPDGLDHFHVYPGGGGGGDGGVDDDEHDGLHAHVDVGVAIAMVPALQLGDDNDNGNDNDSTPSSRGLVLFDDEGNTWEPTLPSDAVVILLGQGASTWAPGAAASNLKPALHSMRVPAGGRAWYGRMILPHRATTLPSAPDVTFGAWRDGAHALFQRHGDNVEDTVGCGSVSATTTTTTTTPGAAAAARRQLSDEGSCGSDAIYCWMSCVVVDEKKHGCTADVAVCQSTSSSKTWPEDFGGFQNPSHCDDCTVACPLPPPPPPPPVIQVQSAPVSEESASTSSSSTRNAVTLDRNAYCNANVPSLSMRMDGFLAGADWREPCVLYLFNSWAIETQAQMTAAVFGTILLGVILHAITFTRMYMRKRLAGHVRWLRYCVEFLLHLSAMVCAYFLMLVAMSYQVELFMGVVVGLSIGHVAFMNYRACFPTTIRRKTWDEEKGQEELEEKEEQVLEMVEEVLLDPCCPGELTAKTSSCSHKPKPPCHETTNPAPASEEL